MLGIAFIFVLLVSDFVLFVMFKNTLLENVFENEKKIKRKRGKPLGTGRGPAPLFSTQPSTPSFFPQPKPPSFPPLRSAHSFSPAQLACDWAGAPLLSLDPLTAGPRLFLSLTERACKSALLFFFHLNRNRVGLLGKSRIIGISRDLPSPTPYKTSNLALRLVFLFRAARPSPSSCLAEFWILPAVFSAPTSVRPSLLRSGLS